MYVPKDFDLPDYDRELFKKQMDLETVRITLIRDLTTEEERKIPYA